MYYSSMIMALYIYNQICTCFGSHNNVRTNEFNTMFNIIILKLMHFIGAHLILCFSCIRCILVKYYEVCSQKSFSTSSVLCILLLYDHQLYDHQTTFWHFKDVYERTRKTVNIIGSNVNKLP